MFSLVDQFWNPFVLGLLLLLELLSGLETGLLDLLDDVKLVF